MLRKIKKIILTVLTTAILTVGFVLPAFAADGTLALTPRFNATSYAALNPQVAVACNFDSTAMYQYYMTTGVKQGQRVYATLIPTTNEMLFLYMANNRSLYVNNGLNANFPYFNLANYIALNPDLVPLYGTNAAMYLYHYINYGIYEGRPSGTVFDPARAIVWNSGVCALGNPSLDPGKIFSNYALTTGLITTATIQVSTDGSGNLAAKQVTASTPAPAASTNDTVRPASCASEHFWDYYYNGNEHKRKCRRCGREEKTDQHSCEFVESSNCDNHTMRCACGYTEIGSHDFTSEDKCRVCGYHRPKPEPQPQLNPNPGPQPPAPDGSQPPANGGPQPPAPDGNQPPADGGPQPPAPDGGQQPVG